MSDNSDFTTLSSWDGGGHTSETWSSRTVWYSDMINYDDVPKSYSNGSGKSTVDDTNQYAGNLYNWLVATAGKGVYLTPPETTIEDSICPYGWRLPIGGSENKSWHNLLSGITTQTARSVPYSFIRIGYYNPTSGNLVASGNGYYWGATTAFSSYYSNGVVYNYYVQSNVSNPLDSSRNGVGYSIRCVSR